jgi:DNA-binding transcriptional MerR regulator
LAAGAQKQLKSLPKNHPRNEVLQKQAVTTRSGRKSTPPVKFPNGPTDKDGQKITKPRPTSAAAKSRPTTPKTVLPAVGPKTPKVRLHDKNPLSSLTRQQREQFTIQEIREVNDATRKGNEDRQIAIFLRQLKKDEEREAQQKELDKQLVNGAVKYLTGLKVNAYGGAQRGKRAWNKAADAVDKLQEKSNTYNQHKDLVRVRPNVGDSISQGISGPAGDAVAGVLRWGRNPVNMLGHIAGGYFGV